MTPEEAKPQKICIMSEMVYADGMFQGPIREGFTAKETAEIAHAYAQAIAEESRTWVSANQDKHEAARAELTAWRDKFEEWSK